MAFIVDTTKFQAEGALLDWGVVAQRLGMTNTIPGFTPPTVLQLRWTLNVELGLPTEPFTVWRRSKRVRGLKLPEPVLRKIFRSNAFRWIPGLR